ncbi:hydrogenase maturation nickel metallochaperone HypA [Acetobacteraceae bacterium]|nr:hydrogenase maturation nickel metallochaperone HypA [Acetobacteraceae bacterium]
MHELTLCESTLEIIQKRAQEHQAERITGLWLEIGAFSCIESEALKFCFDMVCQGTMAQGCKLHLIEEKAETWCRDCQEEIELLIPKVLVCPKCEGRNLRVKAEDGVQIKRLEIE